MYRRRPVWARVRETGIYRRRENMVGFNIMFADYIIVNHWPGEGEPQKADRRTLLAAPGTARRLLRRHENMVGVNMVLAECHQIQTRLL